MAAVTTLQDQECEVLAGKPHASQFPLQTTAAIHWGTPWQGKHRLWQTHPLGERTCQCGGLFFELFGCFEQKQRAFDVTSLHALRRRDRDTNQVNEARFINLLTTWRHIAYAA
jgi:hypothetical protein